MKAGTRLKSAACDTEVMVIRTRPEPVLLCCGGIEMIAMDGQKAGEPDAAFANGTLVGKRYVDEGDTTELLCTKGGKGSLAIDGTPLAVKEAKALPSSD
ncbi:hypothetical protein GO615_26360 [Aromatoleum evansii]|nr:hypothetical protein [Aromatoleum evansii]